MKVLGKVKNGYIVEISEIEVGELAGVDGTYYQFNVKSLDGEIKKSNAESLSIGDLVDVSDIYGKSRCLLNTWDSIKSSLSSLKGNCTKFQNTIKDLK